MKSEKCKVKIPKRSRDLRPSHFPLCILHFSLYTAFPCRDLALDSRLSALDYLRGFRGLRTDRASAFSVTRFEFKQPEDFAGIQT